ncbi:PREDICTED: uncharacterized protein LOC106811294 isoform X2 [Priapulus caudatus]|uniref:Uncharacterized protein LOC106811294 isoform X2 n=1 Tax=Priapulus caudatus TaxID=37621 RepID=A0ABM1EDT0_PRICU|nr:PREDICTED: uncharacterized protein LOC106811294 isoform X2 [Priapulus caudatus]
MPSQSSFRQNSHLDERKQSGDSEIEEPSYAKLSARRTAIIPGKFMEDEGQEVERPAREASTSPNTNPGTRRRSSVVFIPPSMQICPGDLFVPAAYSRTLTRGYTLSGSAAGPMYQLPVPLESRATTPKAKSSPWSLLKLAYQCSGVLLGQR